MARLDSLFRALVDKGGSDLHLGSGEPPRIRLDGDIAKMSEQAIDAATMTSLLQEIAPPEVWEHFDAKQDADFAYAIKGLARFRCNYFCNLAGPGAVFRVIPDKILTAEQLGLSDAIMTLCKLHKGLVLVTGPTGSGKSTTLAAMIDWINRNRTDHILTIEDPVEFVHPNKKCLVNQREVGSHTESFKAALKGALREDPDIILCGELRDLETIHIALEMAETGHLVFGTLHTNTAASTVDRIIDQFPADQQDQVRTMLASSLKGVVSQTLLKKIGGGRIAALEVLIVNNAVSSNIREGKTHQIPSAMQTGGKLGMVQLNTALLKLVQAQKVTPEGALSKAIDKDGLLRELQRNGIAVKQADAPAAAASPSLPPTERQAPSGELPSHTNAHRIIRQPDAAAAWEKGRPAAAPAAAKKSRWFQ